MQKDKDQQSFESFLEAVRLKAINTVSVQLPDIDHDHDTANTDRNRDTEADTNQHVVIVHIMLL